jgi:ABC-type sulfate transport system permease component
LIRANASELVALLQAGELDYIVDYESLARANRLRFVTPAAGRSTSAIRRARASTRARTVRVARRTDTTTYAGAPIVYARRVPRAAPHPRRDSGSCAICSRRTGRRCCARHAVDALRVPELVGRLRAAGAARDAPVSDATARGRGTHRVAAAGVVAGAVLLLALLGLPIVALLLRGGVSGLGQLGSDRELRAALWLTAQTATVATLLAVLLGTPLAYLLARGRMPAGALVGALLDLPLLIPHPVAGMALLLAFGRASPAGAALAQLGLAVVGSRTGIVLAMLFVAAPLYVSAAREAIARVDERYESVARTLGDSPVRAAWRVTRPLAGRGLVAAAAVMWARAVSEFGAIVILTYKPEGRERVELRPVHRRGARRGASRGRGARDPRARPAARAALASRGHGAGRARAMIEVESLHARAGAFELRDVSFSLPRGAWGIVLGSAGSGKTTLLETVAGVRRAASGRVRLRESDVTLVPPERRGVGIVYQHALLFPHPHRRGERALRRARARYAVALARRLGAGELLARGVRELSGGERQMVALGACARPAARHSPARRAPRRRRSAGGTRCGASCALCSASSRSPCCT